MPVMVDDKDADNQEHDGDDSDDDDDDDNNGDDDASVLTDWCQCIFCTFIIAIHFAL